jgi:hypothetical protein
MASAPRGEPIPAGGAGAPSPIYAPGIDEYTSIYDKKGELLEQFRLTFDIINRIVRDLDERFVERNHVHFYLKGGNSIPFFENPDPTTIPSAFPSDFDFALAIDPKMPINIYNILLLGAINEIIYIMTSTIQEYYPVKRSQFEAGETRPCIILDRAYTPTINKDIEDLFKKASESDAYKCHTKCPFRIFLRKNFTTNTAITQNFGTIMLQYIISKEEVINIMDISFFIRTLEQDPAKQTPIAREVEIKLRRDWDMTRIERHTFTAPVPLTIDIYDRLSAYLNHHIAIEGNTRPEKVAKRKHRMSVLKNIIEKSKKRVKHQSRRITKKRMGHIKRVHGRHFKRPNNTSVLNNL